MVSDLLDEFLNSADQCFIKNFCSYVHQGDFSIIFIFCCVCQVDNINNHTDLVLPPHHFHKYLKAHSEWVRELFLLVYSFRGITAIAPGLWGGKLSQQEGMFHTDMIM